VALALILANVQVTFNLPVAGAKMVGVLVGVPLPVGECITVALVVPEIVTTISVEVVLKSARSKSSHAVFLVLEHGVAFTETLKHSVVLVSLLALDLDPVLVLSSPFPESAELVVSANDLTVDNHNVTGTITNIKPLVGMAELPLPDRIVVAVNTNNLVVLKGDRSCSASNSNPLTVTLVPPD
jgi:hypothetical protein